MKDWQGPPARGKRALRLSEVRSHLHCLRLWFSNLANHYQGLFFRIHMDEGEVEVNSNLLYFFDPLNG